MALEEWAIAQHKVSDLLPNRRYYYESAPESEALQY